MWINLTEDELAIVKRGIDREVGFHLVSSHDAETKAAQAVQDRFRELSAPNPNDQAFAEAAWEVAMLSEPHEIEGMPGGEPFVSHSDDGAYVMAWIWVDNEDAGITNEEDEDEEDA